VSNYQFAEPLSKSDIKKFVSTIRNSCNLSNILYMPVIWFIEVLIPAIDNTFNYEIVEQSQLPPNTYACYDPSSNTMKISESVYDGACDNNGRDRFTLAHEIGHYFLHRTGVKLYRSDQPPQAFVNPEWQANYFASELLMPSYLIQGMSIDEIKCKCKTSYQAAEIAFKNANKNRAI
jgi:hypothetical protein